MTRKQQDIVQTAKDLFWKHGVSRVTMEEISDKADVSKMTLYKYYSNKKELALEVLKNEVGKAFTKFEQIIHSDLPFEEKLEQMFLMKLEGTKGISREFISDIYQNPKLGLYQYIEEQSRRSTELFRQFLEESQRQGLIRKDLKIPFVQHYMNHLTGLVTDQQLLDHYNNPQELIMESMRFMFYGLLPRK
jgi:AcrR family transcriptional regulator